MPIRPPCAKDRVSPATGQLLIVAAPAEAEAVRELLHQASYGVQQADDLGRAAAMLGALTPPALVLIDDSAAGDLVAFLLRLQRTHGVGGHPIPAVLLSTADGASPRGISEVVTKPFEGPLLLEVIQRLLERG